MDAETTSILAEIGPSEINHRPKIGEPPEDALSSCGASDCGRYW
jgi:hypothetical protein